MGLFFVQLGICNEKIPLVFSGIFELDLYVVVIPNPYIFFGSRFISLVRCCRGWSLEIYFFLSVGPMLPDEMRLVYPHWIEEC